MTRRAKIVATLGPSSNTVEVITELIRSGLNVARINMSHGTHEAHAQTIRNVREASKITGWEVAILLDLQGPKIRVDKLSDPLELKDDSVWVIGSTALMDKYPQYKDCYIPTTYTELVSDAHIGAQILFDDGLMAAEAIEKDGDVLKIKVTVGGTLKSNKGINLPGVNVSAPSFTEKDEEDLMFGLAQKIDYVALSFVRKAEDIRQVKILLHKLKVNIPIVSKIEKPEALDNIDEIIDVTDVIMIARGDMGVEVGNHLVPAIQKRLILKCNEAGIPVITATQMLESMVNNPRPTRAEASDVANAIWDGTDAVMLSGETASGDYPLETIKMMGQIIEEAETTPKERPLLRNMDLGSVSASLQVAASLIAEKVNAKWIVSITQSGNSCFKMTRFRPKVRVLGVAKTIQVVRRLCLLWGVTPFYFKGEDDDSESLEFKTIDSIREKNLVTKGDKIVCTRGDGEYFTRENSNSVRVEIIKDLSDDIKSLSSSEDMQIVDFNAGQIALDNNLCASCQICIPLCPHDIWEAAPSNERETRINELKAPNCSFDLECVQQCPTGAIEILSK